MITVAMPRLSDSMEEGTIVTWLVNNGARVERGDNLAEIETDKATMTYEADAEGVLQQIIAEGDTVAVGAPIAQLLGAEELPSAADEHEPATRLASVPPGAGDRGDASAPPVVRGAMTMPTGAVRRVKASPLARRIALDLDIDLGALVGSGPGGRIVRADVEAAAVPAPESAGGASRTNDVETVQLTPTQRTIARRMSDSNASVPDFQVRTEVDVTQLLELRRSMKAAGRAASVNDFVVHACGLALREHPRANGSYVDGTFALHARVNVGIAVAGDGTLVVPTIFDADITPVTQIAMQSRVLAAKVRDGTITPAELADATFTVSNLGMHGVTSFTAIVDSGKAAVLAVGAAIERPVVDDGRIVIRSIMDLSLSCDHRILYGADAAAFLADLRELLEQPFALVT